MSENAGPAAEPSSGNGHDKAAAAARKKHRPPLKSGYGVVEKRAALARWKRGTPVGEVADSLKVSEATLYNWRSKFGAAPKKQAKKVNRGGKGTTKRTWDFATKRAAVARLKAEKRKDVQAELGISSGMMTNWIKYVAKGEKKLARLEAKAARLAEAEGRGVVALPAVDTAPQLGGNGKMEAVLFLREHKRHLTRAVKEGRMQVDDPSLLWPMSALNSLLGAVR